VSRVTAFGIGRICAILALILLFLVLVGIAELTGKILLIVLFLLALGLLL